jgi:hypothetical protein
MDSMNFPNLQPFGQSNPEQNQQVYEYSRLNLAAVSREQSADITIVTKEGDTVTLSADSSIEAAYATYDKKAQLKGAYSESMGRLTSATVEREISISVEGDINDQEKKEIKQVMREIFKMMKDFLTGRLDDTAVSAVKDFELDTLANVEAKFEVKQVVLEVNHMSAEYMTDSRIPARESEDPGPMKRLIGRMANALKDAKVEHDRFMKFFEHKPARLSDEYFKHAPDAWKMQKMVHRRFNGLFHQLENMTNSAEDRSHSANLPGEDATLGAESVA